MSRAAGYMVWDKYGDELREMLQLPDDAEDAQVYIPLNGWVTVTSSFNAFHSVTTKITKSYLFWAEYGERLIELFGLPDPLVDVTIDIPYNGVVSFTAKCNADVPLED